MSSYTTLCRLLDHADPFGEEAVLRDVSRRAGLLWGCTLCQRDNVGDTESCEYCTYPRQRDYFRSVQLYS